MTDSVPDTGPLDFKLWSPRWDTHGGRLRCRFHAATTGLTQINEGTAECMAVFLGDLGAAEAENPTWSSVRFRTNYYSDFPDADGWEDRLALTWAVTVETDGDGDPEDAGSHAPGPHGSQAHDDTFADEDEDWERTRERVFVIAGKPHGPEISGEDLSALESAEGVTSADPEVFEGMVALDLGELDFPEGLAKVDAVLAVCRERGLRTNWKEPG
ncbi:hypothetical protein AB0I28_21180 [Phytomonospora sp. NPDC050363]|uniref:hypothetical protein n=1 Tax=Phytomonospora sp. NPDC050363 TaxID=3155642 RepID=UPI0033DEED51